MQDAVDVAVDVERFRHVVLDKSEAITHEVGDVGGAAGDEVVDGHH